MLGAAPSHAAVNTAMAVAALSQIFLVFILSHSCRSPHPRTSPDFQDFGLKFQRSSDAQQIS
jgi:hypothetical protein